MKIIGRIISVCFLLFLIGSVGTALYLNAYGTQLFQELLSSAFKRQVSFSKLIFKPPFAFHMVDLNIESLLKANRVDVYPNFNSFFSQKITIDRVILNNVEFVIRRQQIDILKAQSEAEEIKEMVDSALNTISRSTKSMRIQEMIVRGGKMIYTDHRKDKSLDFTLHNMDVSAQNISLPQSDEDLFIQLSGMLQTEQKKLNGGSVRVDGWVNWNRRNAQLTLNVADRKQKNALKAVLTSSNNDMKVEGDLLVKNFGVPEEVKKEEGSKPLESVMTSVLSTVGVDVGAKFVFNTKMDDFEIENVTFNGTLSTK